MGPENMTFVRESYVDKRKREREGERERERERERKEKRREDDRTGDKERL